IPQKLDVVQRAGSFAQFQLDVRTRKNVAVSLANVFKRGTLEPRSHRDRRRGRRNEIDQQQRDCAYCKHGCSRCFEDLPATESQHSHFPEPQSAVMKANSLYHRGVRATNGHAAAPPPSSVMNSRRFTPVSPCSDQKIAHFSTAGGCCAAGFLAELM